MRRTAIVRRTRLRSRTKTEKAEATRRTKTRRAMTATVAKTLGGDTSLVGGLTRKIEIAIERERQKQMRDANVAYVRSRDVLCRCGCWRLIDDVHEEPPRSQGGDPTDSNGCLGLSRVCHEARHFKAGRERLKITIPPIVGGANVLVMFERDGRVWQTMPGPTGPIVVELTQVK